VIGAQASQLQNSQRLQPPSRWTYALCYALYLVVLGLCYESFWTWRSTVEVVVGYFYRKHEAFQFIYLTGTLLIGLVLFIVIVGSESYLRHGIEEPALAERQRSATWRVLRRFLRVTGWLLGTLLVAFALQEWIFHRVGA
jgi:hypothetical protein